jgi:hypothetical protein
MQGVGGGEGGRRGGGEGGGEEGRDTKIHDSNIRFMVALQRFQKLQLHMIPMAQFTNRDFLGAWIVQEMIAPCKCYCSVHYCIQIHLRYRICLFRPHDRKEKHGGQYFA